LLNQASEQYTKLVKVKTLLFIGLVLVLLGLSAIKIINQKSYSMENMNIVRNAHYVIFPAAAQVFIDGEKETGRWNPTAADAESATAILRECLQKDPRKLLLDNYYLQYAGIVNRSDEQELWVNAFHQKLADHFPKWRQEIVYVNDGGQDFFEAIVNLQSATCRELYIHGEA
jgi:hypothetical protein